MPLDKWLKRFGLSILSKKKVIMNYPEDIQQEEIFNERTKDKGQGYIKRDCRKGS